MFIVAIILYDQNNRMLLQQRTDDAWYCPGKWCFFGGKSEGEEMGDETLVREVKEELGITLPYHPEICWMDEIDLPDNPKVQRYIYKMMLLDKTQIKLGEGQGMGWFSARDIKGLGDSVAHVDVMNRVFDSLGVRRG